MADGAERTVPSELPGTVRNQTPDRPGTQRGSIVLLPRFGSGLNLNLCFLLAKWYLPHRVR